MRSLHNLSALSAIILALLLIVTPTSARSVVIGNLVLNQSAPINGQSVTFTVTAGNESRNRTSVFVSCHQGTEVVLQDTLGIVSISHVAGGWSGVTESLVLVGPSECTAQAYYLTKDHTAQQIRLIDFVVGA